MGNSSNKKNKTHSFYKEANKSILGQRQLSPKKVGKTILKTIKYLVFCFLIVATLWGCINEFRIQTSTNLGQGVEFYQDNDFIYPNMYLSEEVIGYTAAKEEVTNGINDSKPEEAETLPFDFYTFNPNYGLENTYGFDEAEWQEKMQPNNLIINASDIYTLGSHKGSNYFVESPEMYSYNLNAITIYQTSIYSFETSELNYEEGLFTPNLSNQPLALFDEASTAAGRDVQNWMDFALFIGDQKDGSIDGVINDPDWQLLFDYNEDEQNMVDGALSINGTIIPTIYNPTNNEDWLKSDSWKPILSLDDKNITDDSTDAEKKDILENQAKFLVNRLAFNNGTGFETYGDIKDKTLTNSEGVELTIDEAFAQEAESLGVTWDSITYTSNLTELKPIDATKVYGGAETVVLPIPRGFPISPSDKTKLLIDGDSENEGFREAGYQDRGLTDNDNSGFDPSIQNYGWVLLDDNGDIQRVYDTEESAINGDELTFEDEKFALYGDQRRNGWGSIDNEGIYKGDGTSQKLYNESTGEYNERGQSVFDEQVKNYMNGDYYSRMETSFKIGEDNYDYVYASSFAGMSNLNEISKIDSSYHGVLPNYEEHSDGTVWETSILSDSINATNVDSWGSSRVAFVGWSDWGKAWDPNFGPLYGAVVFPLAQLSMGLGEVFHYFDSPWGTLFSIFLIVFLLRGLGALLSIKGTANQLKMQEIQTEVAKIKAKYNKYDFKVDKKMKQKQQMEIMALYRKNEINPFGSLGTIFITMPIFISLWIIISALPAYKLTYLGNFAFSVSAFYGMFNIAGMFFLYLLVGLSVGLVQGVSSKLPTWLSNKRKGIKTIDEGTKQAMKKQNRTQNIMIGVFIFMGLTVPALFAYYWICSGLFTILLELGRHAYRTTKAKKVKS